MADRKNSDEGRDIWDKVAEYGGPAAGLVLGVAANRFVRVPYKQRRKELLEVSSIVRREGDKKTLKKVQREMDFHRRFSKNGDFVGDGLGGAAGTLMGGMAARKYQEKRRK